jgi:hypothetical protein
MSEQGIPRHNYAGEERRIGFEIEYIGLSLERTAQLIVDLFGGVIRRDHRHSVAVEVPELGRFEVELDVHLLQELSEASRDNRAAKALDVEGAMNNVLSALLTSFAPNEVVCPPVPLSRIDDIDELRRAMCREGARGTGDSLAYAFGLHINPEVPSLEVDSLRVCLQSFLLLYDWLERRMAIDLTRKVTQFARPFPREYAVRVLSVDYRPDMSRFMGDYLAFNPTRNRALDMLPLLAWLDEARVRKAVRDDLIKKRPTYHFRMPNCRLDDPDWTLRTEWRHWCLVERLAADDRRREDMIEAWREIAGNPFSGATASWARATDHYVQGL